MNIKMSLCVYRDKFIYIRPHLPFCAQSPSLWQKSYKGLRMVAKKEKQDWRCGMAHIEGFHRLELV